MSRAPGRHTPLVAALSTREAGNRTPAPEPRRTCMAVTSADTAIRPFHVAIADEALDDLRLRIDATQWPEKETVPDDSQGVPLATMQKLARHWATGYDLRRCEAQLNALPQFITKIDGLDIHFVH